MCAMREREQFVVLLRHGIAEDRSDNGSDFNRRLTDAGSKKMKLIARVLAGVFPHADTIYSSPLVRAQETAQHVAEAYGTALPVTTTDALAPSANGKQIRELLERAGGENIICVGHEPSLTLMMLELTAAGSAMGVALKKGGFFGIRYAGGRGHLEWMVPPRIVIERE